MLCFKKTCLAIVVLALAGTILSQDLASFEKRTTVRVLSNGLTVILYERHSSPVFSFVTVVDVGSVQDPPGKSGMAHMFEHMAFKGSDRVGTSDYAKEDVALQEVERAYAAYDSEARKTAGSDPQKLADLKDHFNQALKQANQYVVGNQFANIVSREGGVGLNAFTLPDETLYLYSLPANRLEVWAYLESERFRHPVMREFYRERDIVLEERRLRVDNTSAGRAGERFLEGAYTVHPYRHGALGEASDVSHLSATEAADFSRQQYVPANTVIALVGDLTPDQVFPIIEKYFGRLPAGPKPPPVTVVEPPQSAERTVVVKEELKVPYMEGYHRPSTLDPDNATYDVILNLLANGRTSRLFRSLVKEQKLALAEVAFNGFPGNKYSTLFTFLLLPLSGHSESELSAALHVELERLKDRGISEAELNTVKTRTKWDLIRKLEDNQGLALQLAINQTRYGDWRYLFRSVDQIDKVTQPDVLRVANKTFVATNRVSLQNAQTPLVPLPQPKSKGSPAKEPKP